MNLPRTFPSNAGLVGCIFVILAIVAFIWWMEEVSNAAPLPADFYQSSFIERGVRVKPAVKYVAPAVHALVLPMPDSNTIVITSITAYDDGGNVIQSFTNQIATP